MKYLAYARNALATLTETPIELGCILRGLL